jgi:hypothetical protein
MTAAKPIEVEKFPESDLVSLREELLHSRLDSWQAADLIRCYLSNRGYGVCNDAARLTAAQIESCGYDVERIQKEFEKIALVM